MHPWSLSISEAVELQRKLAGEIVCSGKPEKIDHVAGIDLAYDKSANLGFCAVVLCTYPALKVSRICRVHDEVRFPYVPGLLSFREGPLVLKALANLDIQPDVIIFDGQGIAHPRRLGIAAHMGLLLNMPSIGCAKSRLCGSYEEPGLDRGEKSFLFDRKNRPIGSVLRTRRGVKPVFVSPGHLVGLGEAVEIVMNCLTKYRIPEPVRIADIEATKYKRDFLI